MAGFLDTLKQTGGAIAGGIGQVLDTGAQIAIPEYHDYRVYQEAAQHGMPAILDPALQGRMKSVYGERLLQTQQKSVHDQLKELAQAALMAPHGEAEKIGEQMDALIGKENYFKALLKSADDAEAEALKYDPESPTLERMVRRAVKMYEAPEGRLSKIAGPILSAAQQRAHDIGQIDVEEMKAQRLAPIKREMAEFSSQLHINEYGKKRGMDVNAYARQAQIATAEQGRREKQKMLNTIEGMIETAEKLNQRYGKDFIPESELRSAIQAAMLPKVKQPDMLSNIQKAVNIWAKVNGISNVPTIIYNDKSGRFETIGSKLTKEQQKSLMRFIHGTMNNEIDMQALFDEQGSGEHGQPEETWENYVPEGDNTESWEQYLK